MRIAYLSCSPIPSREANSVQVMRMCEAFAAAGHEVTLIARQGDAGGAGAGETSDFSLYGVKNGFSVVKRRTWSGPGGGLFYAVTAATALRRHRRPDLLYGRDLLSLAAAGGGAPVVLEAHAPPSPADRLLQRWLFRRPSFARLVVISDALRREFERLHPRLPRARIRVAHDAAEAPQGPPAADVLARVRRRKDRLNVGYVGQLYPGKGMELVAELPGRLPEMDFHVVGGSKGDLERWRERTAGLRNLTFHGFVPPGLTDSYRQAMDVLLAPYQERVTVAGAGDISRWMSPLKIFEYMAARKPIVASDLPVLREVLADGHEALLVPAGEPGAWEGALRRLMDPGLRDELAGRAFATFESRHTWAGRARSVLADLPETPRP